MQSKPNTGPVILSCRHLKKSFDHVEILRDITFSVHEGEKIGIVGPNGSGKSTLLKILSRILEADSGVISYAKKVVPAYFPQVHEEQGISGGELAKKIFKPIMESGSNLFLLDEPTNNLDAEGLEVMEAFLRNSSSAGVIISHDRMFLDRSVTKIIEIDPHTKSSVIYHGNYSAYAKEKAARVERAWNMYADAQEKSKRLSREIEKRVSWMNRIEKTRRDIKKLPIHEREKPVAAVLRDQEGRAGRRARLMKDRLGAHKTASGEMAAPLHELPLRIVFEPLRGSTKVFNLFEVEKYIGSKNIGPITLSIQYGDRVHITGRNGAGKTTLLNFLLATMYPDSGKIERGENVRIGYMQQSKADDVEDVTVLERFLKKTARDQTSAREILNRFRITADDVKKKLHEMSPGEYSRLIIAELVALQPNCIILDEPSNHLDLEALEELEAGLADFEGTLIVVSHDRYFVEKIKLFKEIQIS